MDSIDQTVTQDISAHVNMLQDVDILDTVLMMDLVGGGGGGENDSSVISLVKESRLLTLCLQGFNFVKFCRGGLSEPPPWNQAE